MISVDNLQVLKRSHPGLINELSNIPENPNLRIDLSHSKNGLEIIDIEINGKKSAIHSKYDPLREAQLFVDGFAEQIEHHDHVLFYGVGMGYHIEYFKKKYPTKSVTLCEPIPEILRMVLSTKSIQGVLTSVEAFFLEKDENTSSAFLQSLVLSTHGNILLLVFPSYERLFQERVNSFINLFKKIVVGRRSDLRTKFAFQKRWTINSIQNINKTIETPNILHCFPKNMFKDKPAIIVSAGPSLEEEIENLRTIKENNLAYIFSVGSSINTLVNNGIYPTAACTYDPQHTNQFVFDQIVTKGITEIPLIYGSSVGFETIEEYPGSKFHMITSQDNVASYYLKLKNAESLDRVSDAPSIAVVTLQLLCKLGFNPIILVGQNLAYLGDKSYADGSKRKGIATRVNPQSFDDAMIVEDVYGGKVYTSKSFNSMRESMENYISTYNKIKIINTTKGGAKIAGTEFMELEQVIGTYCKVQMIEENWYHKASSSYDLNYTLTQIDRMEMQTKELTELINKLSDNLDAIRLHSNKNGSTSKLDKLFATFDKLTKKLRRNDFYNIYLFPMNRVQINIFENEVLKIRFENDPLVKARMLVEAFLVVFNGLVDDLKTLLPLVTHMHQELRKKC